MNAPDTTLLKHIATHRGGLLYLVRGRDQEKPAWYYVLISDRARLAMLEARALRDSGPIPLEEYGQVLHSGWGAEPPEMIRHAIESTYSE